MLRFRIDEIGGRNNPAYVEIEPEEGYLRFRAGYTKGKAPAAISTGISRAHALDLGRALIAMAKSQVPSLPGDRT